MNNKPVGSELLCSAKAVSSRVEWKFVILLLVLALVHGLIYLSVIPPWQHYDEPAHFERLYWTTESSFSSASTETALSLPLDISASMCESRFWGDVPCSPLPLPYESPPTFEELWMSRQSLYYYLLVPLQIPFRYAPVEIKLYVGRLGSVILYILTLTIAYLLLRDLFPGDREVRLVVPALIALIPAFTEEMSALNNDAGAVAIFSFLLWGIVRLMRDGWSPLALAWVIGAAVLGSFTKRTAMVGIPLGLVAILLSWRRLRWWAWVAGGIVTLGVIIFAFSWSGSASWYELPSSAPAVVRVPSDGPVGQYAVCTGEERYLVQELSPAQAETMGGKTLTLGGWVRTVSSTGGAITFPYLNDGSIHTQVMTMTSEWQFHAMTVTVRPEVSALQVRLPSDGEGKIVCYDGVVLAQGSFPLDEPPRFESSRGDEGVWGGRSFVNILSNGSGERGWPLLRPWASRLVAELRLPQLGRPTLFIQSVLDWKRTGFIYKIVWYNLVQSFWASFGWNHVRLADCYYQWLRVLTLLGLGGGTVFSIRRLVLSRGFRTGRRRALAFLALVALSVWGITAMAYTHPVLSNLPHRPIPVARYAYPAIIPSVLFLFLGWRELTPAKWRRFLPLTSLLGVAWLDIVSLLEAILPYYYLK